MEYREVFYSSDVAFIISSHFCVSLVVLSYVHLNLYPCNNIFFVYKCTQVYGATFAQKRNDALFTAERLQKVVTSEKQQQLPPQAIQDLVLASIAIKYTQSNSVGYARNGQMIGVGAGQQSRGDTVYSNV